MANLMLFESEVEKLNILLKEELFIAEPNLKLFLESAEKPQSIFTLESTEKVIHLLNALPNGVIRNSDVIKNVVESSLSIGVLKNRRSQCEGDYFSTFIN